MTDFNFIADLLVFTGGMLAMGFALLPRYLKSWEEGYKTAEERYSDYDLGFKQGFEAGVITTLQELERRHAQNDL